MIATILKSCSTICFLLLPILIAFIITLDDKTLMYGLNTYIFHRVNNGQTPVVNDPTHSSWRKIMRNSIHVFKTELNNWLNDGNCFPEFSEITPQGNNGFECFYKGLFFG